MSSAVPPPGVSIADALRPLRAGTFPDGATELVYATDT